MPTLPSISSLLAPFRPKPKPTATSTPLFRSLAPPATQFKSLAPPVATSFRFLGSPATPAILNQTLLPANFDPKFGFGDTSQKSTTKTDFDVSPVPQVQNDRNAQIEAIRQKALGIQGQFTDLGTPATPELSGGERSTPDAPIVSPETTKAVTEAERVYQESLKISPEALSTQEDLDKLVESTKSAYRGIEDKPIPLAFITGQLQSVEKRALGLAEPLEAKLARLQSTRTSALEASKFALERADKKSESAVTASNAARTEAIAARTEAESARRFGVTQQLAQDKFVEDKRQFGLTYAQTQQKLDAADAKANKSGSPKDIADSLQGKIDFLSEIGSHSGLNSRVGPTSFSRRAFAVADKFGAGQDFAGSVRQMASQEFLDKLINVKSQGATFGALTDREGDALRAAASKLNDWEMKDEDGNGIGEWNVDEKSFKKELDKIKTLAQKAFDKAGGVSATSGTNANDPLGIVDDPLGIL